MSDNKILVTGGAGYIGSHVVRLPTNAGNPVVVLDNLSTGFADAVLGADLVVGDTGDREVINAINRISETPIKVKEEARRAGDPPALIARADKAKKLLGWEPRYDDLDFIVKTSLDWERKLRDRERA